MPNDQCFVEQHLVCLLRTTVHLKLGKIFIFQVLAPTKLTQLHVKFKIVLEKIFLLHS